MAGKVFFSVTMSCDGFDRVDPARLALDQTRADASSRVTHLTYTAEKR
jgi:hypothetical protein